MQACGTLIMVHSPDSYRDTNELNETLRSVHNLYIYIYTHTYILYIYVYIYMQILHAGPKPLSKACPNTTP